HRIFTLKIATKFPFNNGRVTNHAGAAEVAFVGQVHVAASANRSAEAGSDFVIAQIDVRTTAGAVGRGRLVAYFVFAFAFETRNHAIALPAPHRLELSMER